MDFQRELSILKIFSRFFATLSLVVPLVAVPIIAYYFNNWWLLLGIVTSYLGGFIAAAKNKIIFYLLSACVIGFWLKGGFNVHQYVTFYFLCLLWGFVSYWIMMEYNSKVEILDAKILASMEHNFQESEAGKQLAKDIEFELQKLRDSKKV